MRMGLSSSPNNAAATVAMTTGLHDFKTLPKDTVAFAMMATIIA
jgi:hypothetical protein